MTRRIHITLNESTSEVLENLAEDFHNGNTSACVRAAIQTYRRSQGNGELESVELLRNEIEQMRDDIDELPEEIQTGGSPAMAQLLENQSRTTTTNQTTDTDDTSELHAEIQNYLLETSDYTASVNELANHLEKSPSKIHKAAAMLVDNELIVINTDDENGSVYFELNHD